MRVHNDMATRSAVGKEREKPWDSWAHWPSLLPLSHRESCAQHFNTPSKWSQLHKGMSKKWDFLLKLFVEMLGKRVNSAKQITNYYLPMILKISLSSLLFPPKFPLIFHSLWTPSLPFSVISTSHYQSTISFFYKTIFLAPGISKGHTHAHSTDYVFENWRHHPQQIGVSKLWHLITSGTHHPSLRSLLYLFLPHPILSPHFLFLLSIIQEPSLLASFQRRICVTWDQGHSWKDRQNDKPYGKWGESERRW